MHQALKDVLGEHVQQAGSLVHPDYLRFDLSHYEKITNEQIREIERNVNSQILLNNSLDVSVKLFDEAKNDGAIAMFGEKYGEEVRVITIADYSKELCGGTHVDRTGDIGLFKIIEESSLAAGVRRIVAVSGQKSVEYVQGQSNVLQKVQSQLNCGTNDISSRIDQLILQNKTLEKELKVNKKADVSINIKTLMEDSHSIGKHSIVIKEISAKSLDELKDIGDSLLNVMKSGVGVLGAEGEKPSIVIVVTQDLIKLGINAGDLAKNIGALMGGGGGGKPHLATAGGIDSVKLKKAMEESLDIIKELIEGKS
jgi:alanyl-tRNA synthetase